MEAKESQLAVVQHRMAEAEARVKAQVDRIAELTHRGQDTTQAKATLAVFEMTLRFMREDLAREQERATNSTATGRSCGFSGMRWVVRAGNRERKSPGSCGSGA